LKTRILLGGLAALAVMAFGVASASATTISPQGPIAPLSGAVNWKVGNLAFTCSSSTIPGVVNANGTITGGKPTFVGCNSGLGATTITAKEPVRYELAFTATGLKTTLRNINLNFNLPTHGCSFNVTGYETTENTGLSPLTVSKLAFSNASTSTTPATLRLTSFPPGENGFCTALFANYPYVAFAATYSLSPPLVVSK
jgi:hypothetical protein